MRRFVAATTFLTMLAAPGQAGALDGRAVYVNCDGSPGDGSWSAPFNSITAALPSARALSASYRVTINVRGTCRAETFPLALDFPVHLQGQRWGKYDGEGWPLPDAWRDTVIVRPSTSTAPASMLLVTAGGVRISRISIDGQLVLAPDGEGRPPPSAPIGILVQGADGFSIQWVRVSNAAIGIRSNGSSGDVTGCHVGPVVNGVAVFGGTAEDAPSVVLFNNRILYRLNGVPAAGGISANAATGQPAGTELALHLWRNDIVTTYSETGPTNPAAIRYSPVVELATDGHLSATALYNRISGPTKYAIMVHGGPQVAFGGGPYTGSLDAWFQGTARDAVAVQESISIITFTNARATIYPDPRFLAAPYLEGAVYRLWHGGELDGVLIDHPAELGNALFINDQPIATDSFVLVPSP